MGVVIPAGYGLARFNFQLTGKPQPFVWTCGFVATAVQSPEWFAQTIRGYFVGTGRPYDAGSFSSAYTFAGVDVTVMTVSGPVVGADRTSVAGGMTINVPPPNCSMLIRKNTGLGGRRGRGRAFLPPIHVLESDIDALGNMTSSIVAALQTRYNAAMTAWLAGGAEPVLLHDNGATPNPITSLTLQAQLATQRRRLR